MMPNVLSSSAWLVGCGVPAPWCASPPVPIVKCRIPNAGSWVPDGSSGWNRS